MAWGLGFRFKGVGFSVYGVLGFVKGLGFDVYDSGVQFLMVSFFVHVFFLFAFWLVWSRVGDLLGFIMVFRIWG